MGRVVVGVALGLLLCDCVNLISVMADECGRSRRFIESKTESEKEWSSEVPGRLGSSEPPSYLYVHFLES